jgi:SAM-dependent methyltransferase
MTCPLCSSSSIAEHTEAHGRRYIECGGCKLLFVNPEDRPSAMEELLHYRTHENDVLDERYRAFLARLANPLVERLEPGSVGLDFGCGPGPALARMLEERGFEVVLYDPFFVPDVSVLGHTYDFITCTEVVEHFHHPAEEFARLADLLRPGGWLGVMTEVPEEDPDIPRWRYARDPTHVCFYREETLDWLAKAFEWSLERPAANVALFQAS